MSHKIVGRYTDKNPRWAHGGKVGTQAVKRVYTTKKDFDQFSPETIKRWLVFRKLDVEVYEMIKDEWVMIYKLEHEGGGE